MIGHETQTWFSKSVGLKMNSMVIFKLLYSSQKYPPFWENQQMSGPKKSPGCSSYSECHNSGLQSLAGLFGEACITSACNMPDSNQHSSSHEHWWLLKSKINLVKMQANWFSWVPVQICLKHRNSPTQKLFILYLLDSYTTVVSFFSFFFSQCSDLIPVSHTHRALFMTPEGLL